MGDGGWGMGHWGLAPTPNPQSPIPNPQSPIPIKDKLNLNDKNVLKIIILLNKKYLILLIINF